MSSLLSAATRAATRFVPVIGWGRGYQRIDLRPDLAAGLTVGAMLVPQGMAYAQLAGLPPEIGLYSVTLPLLVYALFGTSRQLAVGPVAVVSLLTASALAPLADGDVAAYISAAALLALMVGVINLVLGAVRMGWVTNLLSHSVLVGYTAAAAIIIGASQVKHVLGVKIPRTEGFAATLTELGHVLDQTEMLTLVIGLATLAVLVLLRRWKRTFPAALAVVVAGVLVSVAFDLDGRGVAVVGDIPGGLPDLGLPSITGSLISDLWSFALTITLVGYMESVAVAKVYARRNRYDLDPNQELIALGASNIAASCVGGQPVTGGFSRTAVNASAGARTQLASVVSAVLITLVLLFFTGLFTQLPQAVLGAIVIAAVTTLFDVAEMRHIMKVKRADALTMGVAFIATLAFGVELGIAIAVAASLVLLVTRVMNPHSAELGRVPGSETFRNIDRFPDAERQPGVGILRIDVALNFANVAFLKRRLRQLSTDHPEGLRRIVLDGAGINDLDASAESALTELVDEYAERGIDIHLANMKGPVRDVLIRSGLWTRLDGHVHPSVHLALAHICGEPTPPVGQIGLDERTVIAARTIGPTRPSARGGTSS
jgi:sulfate permease, SulP family